MKTKLVLSGSGTLLYCHAGAIIRLVEEGYEIEEICGTSGGAIVAGALGSGYKPTQEVIKLLKDLAPANFSHLLRPSLWNFFWNWGLFDGEGLEELFKEYFVETLDDCVIPTHIVTADIQTKSYKVFSSTQTPHVSLAKAVHASMAIPLLFNPVEINKSLYVDGGVASNFHLDYFGAGEDVIGMKFKTNKIQPGKIKNLKDYVGAIVNTMIMSNMQEHIEDAEFAKTIVLKSDQPGLNLAATAREIDIMIEEGYKSADKWVKGR